MKKLINKPVLVMFTFLLIILSALNLTAFEYPFDVERINVDFNGICSNHNSIIAYGTGSMILRTTDDGNTWEQIKVAHDSLEIMKIINLNDNYFGILTDNYLVSSIDNGKTWKKVKVSDNLVYDINSSNDNIYLLSDKQVLVYDVGLNYLETLNIDYKNSRKKFLISNNNILIPQDTGKLIIYDVELKKKIKLVDFKNLGLCSQCIDPFNLSVNGNNIFMTIDSGNVIKSTDEGLTWKIIALKTKGIGKATSENYYYIYTSGFGTSPLATPVFFKIDSLNNIELKSQTSLDRVVLIEDLLFSDIIEINQNTFFAVGRNKSIIKSIDGGVNWTVVSHLAFAENLFFVNENLYYKYSYNGIVGKTTNQGVTWLPQQTFPEAIKQGSTFDLAFFDSVGKGFVYKSWGFANEYNFMATKNYGETFEYKEISNLRMNLKDNYKSKLIKNDSGITILNNMRIGKDHYTTIYQIDSNFNYIDYSILDSTVICEIFQLDGPKYMAIGLERREPGPGQLDNDSFAVRQFWLLNSDDYGRTWTKDKSFGYPGLIGGSCRVNNNVLFFSSMKDSVQSRISHYSLHNLNLETKNVTLSIYPDTISSIYGFFNYQNKPIVNGYYYNILNEEYPTKLSNWIKIENAPYSYFDTQSGKNCKIIACRYKYKTLYFKLIAKDTTTGINIETQTAFYANPPYPIPAKNYVNCQIFWDQRYDIDFSIFKVYNIYGSIVSEGEGFDLNKTNSYSGILTWSPTSDLPVGTYYIKINHGDAVKVVPVILLR